MVFGDGITIRKSRGKKSFKINWTSFFLTDDAKLNLHQDCLLLVPSTQIQMEEIQRQSASGETTVALSHKILKLNCFFVRNTFRILYSYLLFWFAPQFVSLLR